MTEIDSKLQKVTESDSKLQKLQKVTVNYRK